MTIQEGVLHQDDINLVPIQEQLENFSKLGKAVKRMLHYKEKEDKASKE